MGVLGWMVALDYLRGLFQPMILLFYDSMEKVVKKGL